MNDDLRERTARLEDAVADGRGPVRVITIGGDPDRGGVYSPEEYRERFGEDPPGGDGPTVAVVDAEDAGGSDR